MDTKPEEHTNFITDIRFRPNSTQLATSSSDGTVRLWNAAEVFSSSFFLYVLLISNSYFPYLLQVPAFWCFSLPTIDTEI